MPEKNTLPFAWWMIPLRIAQFIFSPLMLTTQVVGFLSWCISHPPMWLGAVVWGYLRFGEAGHYFWFPQRNEYDFIPLPGRKLPEIIWAAWWHQPTPRQPHPRPVTF